MLVTVTDYKTNTKGEKVTIDTANVRNIYSGISVFDGRSFEGWNVLLNEKGGLDFTTILIDKEDCKLLRTAM